MSNLETGNTAYSPQVIDFVTVGVEFSSILESEEPVNREEWTGKMLKLLPLLYIKASLFPEIEPIDFEMPETFVKETDYNRVENRVSNIMGEENVYLDTFIEDMKYSDRPISAFISENIADIYQDVRNLISIYQHNMTEQMNSAIYVCRENFYNYWGQKLVNVLRPLHSLIVQHNGGVEEDFPDYDSNLDNTWD